MSRPRLALVVSESPTVIGGVERCTTTLAELARDLGWDVSWHVANLALPGGLRARRGARWLRPWWGVLAPGALAVQLRRRWRDDPPDLIVSHGPIGWGLGHELDRRRIHFYHGTYVEQALRVRPGISPAGAWLLRNLHGKFAEGRAGRSARRAVANAPGTAREVRRHYGVEAEVVGLPLDLDAFAKTDRQAARRRLGLDDERPVVATVLRDGWVKGIDRWRAVVERTSDRWSWVVAGALSEPPAGVRAVGTLPLEQLAAFYAAADLVMVPSRYESFGYVVAEALAVGTPVVATPAAGAVELLLGETPLAALQVPMAAADDPSTWIARIEAVLSDLGHWRSVVAAHRPRLERTLGYPAWRRRLVGWLEEVADA